MNNQGIHLQDWIDRHHNEAPLTEEQRAEVVRATVEKAFNTPEFKAFVEAMQRRERRQAQRFARCVFSLAILCGGLFMGVMGGIWFLQFIIERL